MLGPCGLDDFWSRCLAGRRVDQESAVAVAGVAGLEAGRFALSRSRTERLLAVAPVLRRRAARTGERAAVAVLQTGEGTNRVGVGGTQALTPDGLAFAVDLPGASRAGRPAEKDRGGEHGRRRG